MVQTQKCIFWEKGPKHLTALHLIEYFHNSHVKLDGDWGTRVAKSTLKTRNINDKC